MIFSESFLVDFSISEWVNIDIQYAMPQESLFIFKSFEYVKEIGQMLEKIKDLYEETKVFIIDKLSNDSGAKQSFNISIGISSWIEDDKESNYMFVFKKYQMCRGINDLLNTLNYVYKKCSEFIEKLK